MKNDDPGSTGLPASEIVNGSGTPPVKKNHAAPAAVEEKAGRAGGIDCARDMAAGEERLHRRGGAEGGAVVGNVERLDAVRVAPDEQPPPLRIPDREGEHAAQQLDHPLAVVPVQLEQYLGVARGAEADAEALQARAQLGVVVDLAVEDDVQPPRRIAHRLIA